VRHLPLFVSALLVFFGNACATELPPVQLESEHVRLRGDEPDFCEGTIDWLEHHYRALSAFLGVELPPGAKIDMVVMADWEELAATCHSQGIAVDGCADGTKAYSIAPFHPHELVHAYASLLGDPPFFFQEGLAEVIGCGEKWRTPKIERPDDLRPILTTSGFRSVPGEEVAAAYGVAAELTRHLIDVHGRDAYLAFYASIGRGAKLDAIDAAMRAHFGQGLDAILTEYAASTPRSRGELCLRIAECTTPALGTSGATLTCGVGVHPLTLLEPNLSALTRSVPAVADGEGLRFYGEGLPAIDGAIASCDGSLDASLSVSAPDAQARFEVWTNPPPGDYALTAWQSLAGSAVADGPLALERVASPAGADCGGGVRVVPAGTSEITVVGDLGWSTTTPLPNGRARQIFAFELSEDVFAEPLVELRTPRLEAETAWLCEGGCPDLEGASADCVSVDLAPAVPYEPFLIELPGRTALYLIIDGTPSDTGFTFGLRLASEGA
jgi:hypothetical protein